MSKYLGATELSGTDLIDAVDALLDEDLWGHQNGEAVHKALGAILNEYRALVHSNMKMDSDIIHRMTGIIPKYFRQYFRDTPQFKIIERLLKKVINSNSPTNSPPNRRSNSPLNTPKKRKKTHGPSVGTSTSRSVAQNTSVSHAHARASTSRSIDQSDSEHHTTAIVSTGISPQSQAMSLSLRRSNEENDEETIQREITLRNMGWTTTEWNEKMTSDTAPKLKKKADFDIEINLMRKADFIQHLRHHPHYMNMKKILDTKLPDSDLWHLMNMLCTEWCLYSGNSFIVEQDKYRFIPSRFEQTRADAEDNREDDSHGSMVPKKSAILRIEGTVSKSMGIEAEVLSILKFADSSIGNIDSYLSRFTRDDESLLSICNQLLQKHIRLNAEEGRSWNLSGVTNISIIEKSELGNFSFKVTDYAMYAELENDFRVLYQNMYQDRKGNILRYAECLSFIKNSMYEQISHQLGFWCFNQKVLKTIRNSNDVSIVDSEKTDRAKYGITLDMYVQNVENPLVSIKKINKKLKNMYEIDEYMDLPNEQFLIHSELQDGVGYLRYRFRKPTSKAPTCCNSKMKYYILTDKYQDYKEHIAQGKAELSNNFWDNRTIDREAYTDFGRVNMQLSECIHLECECHNHICNHTWDKYQHAVKIMNVLDKAVNEHKIQIPTNERTKLQTMYDLAIKAYQTLKDTPNRTERVIPALIHRYMSYVHAHMTNDQRAKFEKKFDAFLDFFECESCKKIVSESCAFEKQETRRTIEIDEDIMDFERSIHATSNNPVKIMDHLYIGEQNGSSHLSFTVEWNDGTISDVPQQMIDHLDIVDQYFIEHELMFKRYDVSNENLLPHRKRFEQVAEEFIEPVIIKWVNHLQHINENEFQNMERPMSEIRPTIEDDSDDDTTTDDEPLRIA